MRPDFKQNLFDNFFRQDFTEKEMIIILNNDSMCLNEWEIETAEYNNIHVYKLPQEITLGECLNFGISKSNYDIIAKFDDDDLYSSVYLTEAYQAMKANRADIVGKCTSYIYFEEFKELRIFRYGNENTFNRLLKGGTLVFKKSVWINIKFKKIVESSDSHFLKAAYLKKYKIYSCSKDNYLCIRRKDIKTHTQKLDANEYRRRCILVTMAEAEDILSYINTNLIPSLNKSGEFLKAEIDKCNKYKNSKSKRKSKRKRKE